MVYSVQMTQAEALEILKTGANVFLTGEPGSGKTHTINSYVGWLRTHNVQPAITASTGIAATHINGHTIHSWSGIGIKKFLTEYDLDAISQNKSVVRRVGGASILIIDEISMLSAKVLSMIDAVCREVRRSDAPFGGLQVILVGDFFQLPPITRRDELVESSQESFIEYEREGIFAFTSRAWTALNPLVCYLSEQHRQEDGEFLSFLSALRRGALTTEHKKLLKSRFADKSSGDETQLYSHNADVDAINATELAKIKEKMYTFEMECRGKDTMTDALKRGCLSPEKLALKVGARVMFTKNDPQKRKYANGTLGIIIGFAEGTDYPVVKIRNGSEIVVEHDEWRIEDGGKVLARIIQIPLRLAWAITVHKSQGMSLDAAHMDLSRTFEYGQGYVALSRVRTLSGLSLSGINARALEVHPEILEKNTEFMGLSVETKVAFDRMNPSEKRKLAENFIKSCGGAEKSNAVYDSEFD